MLMREAYRLYDPLRITGGPAWVDEDRFDIEAKVDAPEAGEATKITPEQRLPMLQALLADRFGLKVHHEVRSFPAFDLVVASGGPKLHASAPEDVKKTQAHTAS